MEKLESILEDEEYLLGSLLKLVELGSEEDIFQFIATKLHEITDGALIIVNSYDEDREESAVRVVSGLGKLFSMAINILGQNPIGMKFPITGKDKAQMLEQRLVTGPKGFHELSAGKLSKVVGSALDSLVGVKGVYGMGFSCSGKLYGNVLIITRKEKALRKVKLIERFLIQAGIVYQRSLIEKELRDSEARFRAIYENNIIGFYRTTPDGKILLANDALVRMLDFRSADELKKRDLEKEGYEPAYTRAVFKETIEKSDKIAGMESIWVKRDGTKIFVRESATAVRDRDGNIQYYDGVVEDITEKKRMEEELGAAYKRVEFYNDLMTHDISNFHQGIITSLELLLATEGVDGKRYAWMAMRNALDSQNLISNLRKYRKLETGGLEAKPMDLAAVFRNAADCVVSQYPGKKVHIKSNFTGMKYKVMGNDLLFDAIFNVLSNAAKFDSRADVEIEAVAGKADDGHWQLEIKDNGPGIADELKDAIFNRECRLDHSVKGTGLGLTLARSIVTSLGGDIRVKDNLSGSERIGSVFVMTIPGGG